MPLPMDTLAPPVSRPTDPDAPGASPVRSLALHLGWDGRTAVLWAEDRALAAGARAPGQGRVLRTHPFATDPDRLRSLAAGGPADEAAGTALELWLPSRTGAPLGSWEDRPGAARPAPLRRWKVPALALDGAVALRWLLEQPEAALGGSLAPAAAVWRWAARCALALGARRAYLPALWLPEPGGAGQAHWRPLPRLGRDRRALAALAEALAPVDRLQFPGTPPEAILEGFLAFVLDRLVRGAVADPAAGLSGAAPGRSAAARWMRSLLAPRPQAVPGVDAFAREVAAWTEDLTSPAPMPARLYLRLEEPGPADGEWRLQLLLQAADEPSLLLPAEAVWAGGPALQVLTGRGLAAPRAALVSGLARAAVAFPPLGRLLLEAEPREAVLSAAEAHDLLARAAEELAALDVAVQVPAWWEEGPPRPKLTLQLGDAASTGLFGPDSLVAFAWEVAIGGQTLTAEEFLALAALKQSLVRHRGRWVVIGPGEAEAALRLIERGRQGAGLSLGEALQLAVAPEAGRLDVDVRVAGEFGRVLARLRGEGRAEPLAEPAGFQGELRPYQRRGAGWLAFLAELGLGACLADDMGLGKTVQLLALLLARRAARPEAPATLLVCPTSLLGNWAREAERFAPGLRLRIHHGQERLRAGSPAAGADLVLTTYGLLHRDLEALGGVAWDGVVLDEAQNIKNPAGKQAHAAAALRSAWRVALTGTPVENRLADLWALFRFLNPGYLGSYGAFQERFAVPVERGGDAEAAERLRQLVRPLLLRRAKTDPGIADELPPKIESRVDCHLTPEQATLYQAVVDEMIARIDRAEGTIERHGQVVAALTRLKQVCNHPAHYTGDDGPLAGRSGKLARLEELLEELLAAGEQALIFTQYPAFGGRLGAYIEQRFGCPVLFLHGELPAERRTELVARFQEGAAPVFVVSLRAGGTGLNLTAASHVFHFDRWWNPAVEDQATDRAYRIGQRRSVQVHKFVCVGTLEERIDQLMRQKRELAAGVVGSGEGWLAELSTGDLREIFALSREAVGED